MGVGAVARSLRETLRVDLYPLDVARAKRFENACVCGPGAIDVYVRVRGAAGAHAAPQPNLWTLVHPQHAEAGDLAYHGRQHRAWFIIERGAGEDDGAISEGHIIVHTTIVSSTSAAG